jgi:hypothetical protein
LLYTPVESDHEVSSMDAREAGRRARVLILTATYYRLARRAEREAEAAFGDAYRAYKAQTAMFVPRLRARCAARPRWSER